MICVTLEAGIKKLGVRGKLVIDNQIIYYGKIQI